MAAHLVRTVVPMAVRRRAHDGLELVRAPAGRHRARACLAAWRSLACWRWGLRRLRDERGRDSIVAVSLLEQAAEVVAAEPVARYLRARHPQALLVWVACARAAPLLRHHPSLDAVLELGCLTEWIHLREHAPFDRCYDLQPHGRYCRLCRVPLSRPPGERQVTVKDRRARGSLLADLCAAGGLPELSDGPRLHLPDSTAGEVDALALPAGRYAVVGGRPAGPRDPRGWPPDRWRALAEALLARGLPVVEVGRSSALDRRPSGGPYRDLCGRLSLLQQAEVVRRACLFVGVPGTPAHLANAAGTPGVVLPGGGAARGPERCPFTGGYGDGSRGRVLGSEGAAAAVPLTSVLEAVAGLPDSLDRPRATR